MNRKILLIGCVCFSLLSKAQESKQTFSLQEAKEYALANSDQIKNATLDLDIASEKVKETRAVGLPQIDGTGGFNNFFNLPVQVVSANFMNPNANPNDLVAFKAGTDYNVSANVKATQLIFSGSYIVALQVSKFYKELRVTTIEKTKEDVLYNVIQAYHMLIAAKENSSFIDSLVVITNDLVEKQRNYLELGMMTQEDMDQLEFALLTAKNNQLGADLQVKNATSLLKLTMGYPQENEIDITESIDLLMAKNDLKVSSFSIENNITYQLLQQQKGLNEFALKEKKYSAMPSLGAVFQHGYNGYRNDIQFFGADSKWYAQTFWGLQLTVPIFSSGTLKSTMAQSALEIKKNENTIHEFTQNLTYQEVQANNNLESAKEQLKLQEANIQLAKKIYENQVIKAEIGAGNSIVVSQKYNQLIQAQAAYINAVLTVFNAELKLEQLHNNIK